MTVRAAAIDSVPSLWVERLVRSGARQGHAERKRGKEGTQRDAQRRGLPALREPKQEIKQ